jgi:hypothetical protein
MRTTQPGSPKGTVKEGFLCGNPAAAPFKDLDDFYQRGQLVHLEEFFVYEYEWLITKILVPVKEAGFPRASIEDAANALIFTPDPDFVGKLILADHVHPMAPWFQQTEGTIITGESSEDGVVLLYRPSPRSIQQSLVYEWCNLLRIYSSDAAEIFLLTESLEDFVHLETGKTVGDQRIAWNLLGSLLLRQPEETVFMLCVRFPLKAAVFGSALWKALLAISDFRQTAQYPFFLDRAKMICYSASKIGLDALKKLPERNRATERLIEFLGAQDLFRTS